MCGIPKFVGTVSYYHYDGLGSVRLLTDNCGTVHSSYTYDSFGNSVASVSSVANSYGFTGEQQFSEADNLVFLRARYYDSRVGRFISRDPLGTLPKSGKRNWFRPLRRYARGTNLYSYVRNNSVNKIDPSGLYPWGRYPWGDNWDINICMAYCDSMSAAGGTGCDTVPWYECKLNCESQDNEEDVDISPNPDDNWDPWPGPPGVDNCLLFVFMFIILLICKIVIVVKKRFVWR